MANKPLQSIKFPGLSDTYIVPQIDDTLSVEGRAADAKETGDRIAGLKDELSVYDGYFSKTFTANYQQIQCYIPANAEVTVKTIDGNNFTGGSLGFLDANKNVLNIWNLPSNLSSRKIYPSSDAYYVYIGGETAPANVIISPAFNYKSMQQMVERLGVAYATISGNAEYSINSYVLNIGANYIILHYYNDIVFNHETIIEQLGSSKAYETDGNLFIDIGNFNALVYDIVDEKLKIIAYNNLMAWRHIPLFVIRYKSGNAGLLVIPNLDLKTKSLTNSLSTLNTTYANFYSNYKKIAKSCIAYLSNGNTITDYSAADGSFNIGPSTIRAFINGQSLAFSHSDIITQLGSSYAYEDASGNLTIKLNPVYALVYNTSTSALQRVLFTEINQEVQILLFTAYYGSGSIGLLAETDNNLKIRNNKDITPIRLLNSSPSFYDVNLTSNLTRFETAVLNAGIINEQFIFFSDPHCFGGNYESNLTAMMSTIQKYYNCSSTDYILCGGDWLGNSDTIDTASYKLGLIKGIGKSMLGNTNFYNIIGNHDTNYQGTPTLTENQLRNIWFSGKKCYYKIERENCTFYALDTGVDNDDTLTAYRYEQLAWLCGELMQNDDEHNVIFLHIVFTSASDSTQISLMASTIGDIITAYNENSTISLNSETYDFTQSVGHIDFVLCGHVHNDMDSTLGGVPCVSIINTGKGGSGTASFDLCIADFSNRILKMIRVGTGEDRNFKF